MATTSFSFFFFFFLIIILTLTAGQPLSEIHALTTFKLNLHDPLGALNNWDPTTPSAPCDWRGVVCSNNRVRELSLPRLHLVGRLTDQLASLRDLRKLNLHTNNFNGQYRRLQQLSGEKRNRESEIGREQCLNLRQMHSIMKNDPENSQRSTIPLVMQFYANILI